MNNMDRLNKIFIVNFNIEEKDLNENCTFDLLDAWDSIGHMNLISDIEEEFDVMLESEEIMNLKSYNDAVDILKKRGLIS